MTQSRSALFTVVALWLASVMLAFWIGGLRSVSPQPENEPRDQNSRQTADYGFAKIKETLSLLSTPRTPADIDWHRALIQRWANSIVDPERRKSVQRRVSFFLGGMGPGRIPGPLRGKSPPKRNRWRINPGQAPGNFSEETAYPGLHQRNTAVHMPCDSLIKLSGQNATFSLAFISFL